MDARRYWPWAVWALAGLAIEVFALTTQRIYPFTRIVAWFRRKPLGRLAYAGVAAVTDLHLEEALWHG